ncbi:hypothetical protein IVB45_26040 [Bradyrhizobium sp. 4]|uniref:hypothetical protein n=1 Tax=unclassified Bradyrhizobium TaxID=2631580 RepID=UPI001FF7D6F6|nr:MULTISPECIES: hypothetical protein [unclassified Bradyrhizobium]MCK1396853.1 hypothetical protein [Bradyrhizobium sp. 39]MCK1747787.1 hypothetical protein [Bradyrhizobium sp. 135]UPJ33387.1 hypothetical protein IVB45_26040 [Bradyrhizobium sp. 4]
MGAERMHPPRYWRMRAEEFRTKADNCEYPETRDVLRKVAENYDELARRAARISTLESLDELRGGGSPPTASRLDRSGQTRLMVQDKAHDQRARSWRV